MSFGLKPKIDLIKDFEITRCRQQFLFINLGRVLFYIFPLLLLILPHLVFAASDSGSSLIFTPPAGDKSVIFLGNIFGVVDGVLAGTGSQIAGQMFGVFNTAVLSLGGILITYTLLVSTLNTSQEGQFLGQRWSSIWVPMRSIAGISLLLPKASGYCVLQIFVMWVVLQGIGAADKLWSQALSYLNRGGAIVKPNVDPVTAMKNSNNADILNGAYGILTGQVCMAALNKSLDTYQTEMRNDSSNNSTCKKAKDAINDINKFCTTSVPSFINSVNLASDSLPMEGGSYKVPMPNLDSTSSPYHTFNGICGYIEFKPFRIGAISEYSASGNDALNILGTSAQRRQSATNIVGTVGSAITSALGVQSSSQGLGLTAAQTKTMDNSRNIAMSQMYQYLSGVANSIVNNAPAFNLDIKCDKSVNPDSPNFCADSDIAQYPLGTPVTLALATCKAYLDPYKSNAEIHGGGVDGWIGGAIDDASEATKSSSIADFARNVSGGGIERNSGVYKDDACLSWDMPGGSTTSVLLRGNEIKDAVSTYNGMMSASLYIKSQAGNAADYRKTREFIARSEQHGWLLAGAYYFKLAVLTSQVLQKSSSIGNDTDSGLKICMPKDNMTCGAGKWSTDKLSAFLNGGCGGMKNDTKKLFCLGDYKGDYESTLKTTYFKKPFGKLLTLIGAKAPKTGTVPIGVTIVAGKDSTIEDPVYTKSDKFDPNSVFGFLRNGTALVVPGQPGDKQPVIKLKMTFNIASSVPEIQAQDIEAGFWNLPGDLMTFIFNNVVVIVFNMILKMMVPIVTAMIFALLQPPILLLSSVFQGALEVMQNVNVNPILALSNMGVKFIEGVCNGFIVIAMAAVGASMIGPAAIAILMFILPLITVWMGVMLGVGMMTAFYIH